jgi:GNAT superfamily N-acetyltransferase
MVRLMSIGFGKLYKSYLKEREGLDVLEVDHGFMVYKLAADHAYISDYYVDPEYRRCGIGYKMADCLFELCLEQGIPVVYCQADNLAEGVELSKLTIEKYGFQRLGEEGSIVHYKMEVSQWEKK